MRHDGFSRRRGQHLVSEANEAPRGDAEFEVLQVALGFHDLQHAFPHHHQFGRFACGGFGHVDDQVLKRLVGGTVHLLEEDLGLPNLEFVALTAHGFDQHTQVEDAPSIDIPFVLAVRGFDPQGEVFLKLSVETFADVAAGQVVTILSEKRRGVDGEEQTHGGLVDGNAFHGFGRFQVGHGVPDFKAFHPRDGAQVPAAHMVHLFLAKAGKDIEFLRADLFAAVCRAEHVVFVGVQVPTVQTADRNPSRVLAVIQRRDLELGSSFHVRCLRHLVQDDVQQVRHIGGGLLPILGHPAIFCRTVDGGEVQLLFGGVQVEHQVKHLLLDEVRRAIFFVHLVDDHDGLQPQLDGLAKNKSRLRHRAFKGIHHKKYGIGHFQHPLHLAAKIRVARRVDEVDLDVLPCGTYILGKDRDAAFSFQVVVVEDEFARVFAFVDDVALVNDLVDKGGFAVVDVGDDGHIADSAHELGVCGRKGRTLVGPVVDCARRNLKKP